MRAYQDFRFWEFIAVCLLWFICLPLTAVAMPTLRPTSSQTVAHEPQIQQPRRNWVYRGWTKWRDEADGRVYLCTNDGRVCQYTGNRKIYEWQIGW